MKVSTAVIVLLALIAAVSTTIAVLDHLPENETSSEYTVTAYSNTTDLEIYFPQGGVTQSVKVIYDGSDITPNCYIKVIDSYHLSMQCDRCIDINKLSFKC